MTQRRKRRPTGGVAGAKPLVIADVPGWPTDWFIPQLEAAAAEVPLSVVSAIASQYVSDPAIVERFWPWIAFAMVDFKQRRVAGRNPKDLGPVEIGKLLRSISDHADGLLAAWKAIGGCMSAAAGNGNTPKANALARVDRDLVDTFARWRYTDMRGPDPEARPEAVAWQADLISLASRATLAADVFPNNPKAKKGAGSRVPGLDSFVGLLAHVWSGMTGRKATAEKVEKKNTEQTSPAFVLFVQQAASAVGAENGVTIGCIKTALTPK